MAVATLGVDCEGNLHRQGARVVCVAGNPIETRRLLLRSDSSVFPNGPANSSDQVGRKNMRHAIGRVTPWRPGAAAVAREPGTPLPASPGQ